MQSIYVVCKTVEMRVVQGAGGQPEGVYIEVHNRGLPHRNAEMRSIYVVLIKNLVRFYL